ncbi:MAG: hypothetical protein ACQEVA_22070 [Myxococcota bacterium]
MLQSSSRRIAAGPLLAALVACVALQSSCVPDEPTENPRDPDFYDQGEQVAVTEPIEFTEQSYDNISGDLTISDLRDLRDESAFVWYGYSPLDPYPLGDRRAHGEDCSPIAAFENVVTEVSELPATIEGVVTHHPRLLRSPRFCAGEDRFYGSYYLQDETGGILIYKDSRVADFTFGDRVTIRVRGMSSQNFSNMPAGVVGVLAYDNEDIVERDLPIYYEETDENFTADDVAQVRRVRGEVVSAPSNTNFNSMTVASLNTDATWAISLDREFTRRSYTFETGEVVELTGVVADNYGMTMLIYSLGQIERIED